MTSKELQQLLVAGSEKYLQILEAKKKAKKLAGFATINVTNVHPDDDLPDTFWLDIDKPIKGSDLSSLKIKIQTVDDIYWEPDAEPEQYRKTPSLSVRFSVAENDLQRFQQALADHATIKVVSDLTFLIQRLRDFYDTYLPLLHPQIIKKPPASLPKKLTEPMSEEQRAAMENVFASPVSYVWGAPGTGKTNMVLSRCVLRYLLAEERVLLLAPTNNAIEQVLRGVLPVIREAGTSFNKVYKFGASSEEFAKEYPQIVAKSKLKDTIQELKQQIQEIKDALSLHRDYAEDVDVLRKQNHSLHATADAVRSEFEQLDHLWPTLCSLDKKAKSMEAEYISLHKQLTAEENRLQQDIAVQKSYQAEFVSVENRLKSIRFVFWKKKERGALEKKSEQLLNLLCTLSEVIEHTKQTISVFQEQAHQKQFEINALKEEIKKEQNQMQSYVKHIRSRAKSVPAICGLISNPPIPDSTLISRLNHLLGCADDAFAEKLQNHPEGDPEDLKNTLKELNGKLNDLLSDPAAAAENEEPPLLLAGTIDSSIKILTTPIPGPEISHAFIDEAGYTSIARGLVPFTIGCPVALFGDHKQLPPVCEAEYNDIQNFPELSIYALSIAYYEAVLHGNISDLSNRVIFRTPHPSFGNGLSKSSLNHSYRFADSLAKQLQRFYTENFSGEADAEFAVEILDAPYQPSGMKFTNIGERDAIKKYISSNKPEDYIILAPYNNQVALLSAIPTAKDHVSTVHGSQGREWDTVIFSPTDHPTGFLVDSSIPQGQPILVTAISRARKKLVIACDVQKWSHYPDQFITRLLNL